MQLAWEAILSDGWMAWEGLTEEVTLGYNLKETQSVCVDTGGAPGQEVSPEVVFEWQ